LASGPLNGIRVLEFTQIIAGPFGCQNLADMGAEVFKVEPAEGEPWRQFSQFIPGESKWFQTLNRGKKSLVLALQEPEAREVVYRLMPSIDVVVINYRPDVAGRLGIDYDTLKRYRPDLIYLDNTAFGRRGPWANRPGYDIVAQAVSGLMVGEGKFDRTTGAPEAISSTALADYATGIVIAWGVSAALFHRERTGEGQLIETSLLQTALGFQNSLVFDLPVADAMVHARMDRVHQLQAAGATYPELIAAYSPLAPLRAVNIYYRPYQTTDGALVIGALSPSLWAKVRAALDTDFLGMADPNFNPMDPAWLGEARKRVAEIEAKVLAGTTAEWLERFEQHGVPCGPLNFPEDMLNDEQVLANEMVVPLEHDISGPQRQVGPLLKMSASPLAAQGSSPPLGRDTDDIVALAGYTEAEIAGLRERGVIG
jgi:crotonobetainyl-CoA:carnitine CoA-transferase CaiB-like acyl-CoA transferase